MTNASVSLMFESIGPVWDGNEVWLVVAAGATFAAFPAWYATMFSGFYIALLLILVLLIVRVVSFEWREKRDSARWRATWRGRTRSQASAPRSSGALRSPTSCTASRWTPTQDYTGNVLDLFSSTPSSRASPSCALRAARRDLPDAATGGDLGARAAAGARGSRCPSRCSASRSSLDGRRGASIATTATVPPVRPRRAGGGALVLAVDSSRATAAAGRSW